MKQLISQSNLILSFLFLGGCSTYVEKAPSQNDALNSVSKSNAKKEQSYWLQDQLDSFVEDEWNPTMQKDKEIQEKYGEDKKTKEEKHFTLQELADKQAAYRKAHPVDHSKSNVTKLESMPVIGK